MFECPNCREQVKDGARKCPHCQEWLIPASADDTGKLSEQDRVELAERRAAENVQTYVEKALIKRYAVMGLIVAALTGGTITVVVKSNVDSALLGTQQKLAAAEALQQRNLKTLDDFDKAMLRMSDLDKSLKGLTESATDTAKRFNDLQAAAASLRKDQFASSKDVLDVAAKLDDKISALASVLEELDLSKNVTEKVQKLTTKSQTINPVLARAEKRQYPIGVENIPNADQIVDALVARGYSASVFNKEGQYDPEAWQVIWVDSTVPYDFAIDVIKTAIKFYPQLKYMFIVRDLRPGWVSSYKFFLGAKTEWAKDLGLKSLPNDFFPSLFTVKSQEAFNSLVRSYYGEPKEKQ